MYCLHCGKEIPDLAVNCPFCGSTQVEDAAPVSPETTAAAGSLRELSHRTRAKMLLIAALVCFFLPFITVSCTSEKDGKTYYSQSVSGFGLMNLGDSGLNLDTERDETEPAAELLKRLPNVCSIAAFGMGVIAAMLLFLGRHIRAAGRLAVCAAVCLILMGLFFFLLYSRYSPMREAMEESSKLLKVIYIRLRIGLLLSAGCFIAGAVFCFKDRPPGELY
ncbi:MAG: hypothetical protein IK107_00155 [Oscillospiraceae bacterium]|nr:hypothetical protein [Oscillospiraceae bacterium]